MITGRLDQWVRVDVPTEAAGPLGEPRSSWATLDSAWASIDQLSGEELVRARAIEARSTMRVQMRYLPGLTPKCRIVWGSVVLHIGAVRDRFSRGVEHILDCYVVDGEGTSS